MKIPKKNEIRKPSKTKAGVTPVAVILPPQKCKHGTCLFCPTLDVPQSYTPKSPAIMRAMSLRYDAGKQVKARIKSFEVMNHPTDKIELIIMGGTFFDYDKKFQERFVKECFDAMNEKVSKNIKEAQKINETAKHRCVALCLETRPDSCSDKDIERALNFGATRVELGVQIIDDKIYKKVGRGHSVKDVVDATKRLRDAGFKIGYHLMPGLPGSNIKHDLDMIKKVFSDSKFKPDQIKIYPCQVIKGAELEKLFYEGKYKPYTEEETKNLIIEILKIVPSYCRVMRIMREIPPEYMTAGLKRIDLRKDITEELRKNVKDVKEIRFREIGFNSGVRDFNWKIEKIEYDASGGKEIFLQAVNKDNILFGLLRLRIKGKKNLKIGYDTKSANANNKIGKKEMGSSGTEPNCLIRSNNICNKSKYLNVLLNSSNSRVGMAERPTQLFDTQCPSGFVGSSPTPGAAIIRELHVYGQAEKLGSLGKGVQHKGIGKELMKKAEEICLGEGVGEVRVISGVGVRGYYRKLGYRLKNNYMVKRI
ncbi:MAG: tRNA uridine(34) 5-carboxymethylaminomethyl modification radical SAM/GNAT enzyme Elp3 [Nanoarchaeota archaeon]|nr:tRNA uridine(34) 5-carboxymethylaminomethyl modification radical SAM/GNAT enzyme Elp3 [Nanoarchaeota archaeon]